MSSNLIEVIEWTHVPHPAGGILDALKTLSKPTGQEIVVDYLAADSYLGKAWTPAEKYLEWAIEGRQQNTESGYDVALTYAKRAVCRRIDGILYYNHLGYKYESKSYGDKCDILREVGINIPGIINDVIIDPRNDSEHRYQPIPESTARHAVELATLFLGATESEAARKAVVVVHWNLGSNFYDGARLSQPKITTFRNGPMFVVDIFDEPQRIKMVRPDEAKVEYADLAGMKKEELIEMAQLLRQGWANLGNFGSWDPASYRRMFRAAGI
jgi:hypothetical protein